MNELSLKIIKETANTEEITNIIFKRYLENKRAVESVIYGVINSECANYIIEVYMKLVLEDAGFSNDDIIHSSISLMSVLDNYRAEDIEI